MFTDKQYAFIEYLYRRLGFTDGKFFEKYQESLVCTNLIKLLLNEYNSRKDGLFVRKEYDYNHISATDLANFTFCPVGYSIGHTFEVEKSKEAKIGSELHERHNLITKSDEIRDVSEDGVIKTRPQYVDDENQKFFNDVLNSELIFSGHTNDENEKNIVFHNKEYNFYGQPDYVFKNKEGSVFIVEEKYSGNGMDNNNHGLFNNHKVQLASYIHFLDEFDADYGYLVYWKYSYYDYSFHIYKCIVYKIIKGNNSMDFLKTTYNNLSDFISKKYINLNVDTLNPVKCAKCVYRMYCGHKTGRLKQITIPYQSSYHKLYYVPYPDILKRDDSDQNDQK